MKRCKNQIMILLALLLCCLWPATAFAAHEVPDLTRQGSLSVTVRDTESGKAVSGGALTLYKVGYVQVDDGNYSFAYTEGFAACGLDLGDLTGATLANDLAAYAKAQHLGGTTLPVGDDGTVVFPKLDLGLYLVVQTQAAENYTVINPFLVTIPLHEADTEGYVYDINATPKAGTATFVPPPPTPPHDDVLPQTGQLWWPVPVLAVCGLLSIVAGVARRKNAED